MASSLNFPFFSRYPASYSTRMTQHVLGFGSLICDGYTIGTGEEKGIEGSRVLMFHPYVAPLVGFSPWYDCSLTAI